jgi:hypothetical protein
MIEMLRILENVTIEKLPPSFGGQARLRYKSTFGG